MRSSAGLVAFPVVWSLYRRLPGGRRTTGKIRAGLPRVVAEGMNVIMLPYFPSRMAQYDMAA